MFYPLIFSTVYFKKNTGNKWALPVPFFSLAGIYIHKTVIIINNFITSLQFTLRKCGQRVSSFTDWYIVAC